jgi:hypothetical protein
VITRTSTTSLIAVQFSVRTRKLLLRARIANVLYERRSNRKVIRSFARHGNGSWRRFPAFDKISHPPARAHAPSLCFVSGQILQQTTHTPGRGATSQPASTSRTPLLTTCTLRSLYVLRPSNLRAPAAICIHQKNKHVRSRLFF